MNITSNLIGSVVSQLRRRHGLRFFVETGTCHGDTAELAAIAFDRVFSCEIDRELAAQASSRLGNYDNVNIYHSSSVEFLKFFKGEFNLPTLYWLDAHWCGGHYKPEVECPLLDELSIIAGLRGRDVVIVDDIDYMLRPPPSPHKSTDWPTIEEVHERIASWGEPCDRVIEAGDNSSMLVITPRNCP